MPDRTIVFATNNRHALRGLSQINPATFRAFQDDDDDVGYTFDLEQVLDGATITSVVRAGSGVSYSNEANTPTRLTQRLRGFGHIDFKVTNSAGDSDEFRVIIERRSSSALTQNAALPATTSVARSSAFDPTANDDAADGIVVGTVWVNSA